MGYPMAGYLAKAGYSVTVYNRTESKAAAWAEQHGGACAATPAEAANGADVVCCCVGNDDDVRAVTVGDKGAFGTMSAGAVFIDHTTASANVARELETIANDRGVGFLDAPVSGGQAGAENGALTVMVGGQQATYDHAESVMQCYAKSVKLMGDAGAGQLTKMVNQICIAGLVQGLSEGINFAQKAGLDVEMLLDVIGKGAAQSWQMDSRGSTMAKDEFEFGFAVDWMRKDLGLCMDEANSNGALLPATALVDQFYAKIQQRGGGRWDTSSLLRLLNS
ncbi:MAG: 3-hydroxyisobutyrate dehydrogenase [Parasphingorhabdus sp.]|jgi:3-hydroxyisobutyrate dehydrogenase